MLVFNFILILASVAAEVEFRNEIAFESLGDLSFIKTYVNVSRKIDFEITLESLSQLYETGESIEKLCRTFQDNNFNLQRDYTIISANSTTLLEARTSCQIAEKQLPVIYSLDNLYELVLFMKEKKIWRVWLGIRNTQKGRTRIWDNGKKVDDTLFPHCIVNSLYAGYERYYSSNDARCMNGAMGYSLNAHGYLEKWSTRTEHYGLTGTSFLKQLKDNRMYTVCERNRGNYDASTQKAQLSIQCETLKRRWVEKSVFLKRRFSMIFAAASEHFNKIDVPRGFANNFTKAKSIFLTQEYKKLQDPDWINSRDSIPLSTRKKRFVLIPAAALALGAIKGAATIYSTMSLDADVAANSIRISALELSTEELKVNMDLIQGYLKRMESDTIQHGNILLLLYKLDTQAQHMSDIVEESIDVLQSIILTTTEQKATSLVLPKHLIIQLSSRVSLEFNAKLNTDYDVMRTDFGTTTETSIEVITRIPAFDPNPHTVYHIYAIPDIAQKVQPVLEHEYIAINRETTSFLPLEILTLSECLKGTCTKPTSSLSVTQAGCGLAQYLGKSINNCAWTSYDHELYVQKTGTGFVYSVPPKGLETSITCTKQKRERTTLINAGHVILSSGCMATIHGSHQIYPIPGPPNEAKYIINGEHPFKDYSISNNGSITIKKEAFNVEMKTFQNKSMSKLRILLYMFLGCLLVMIGASLLGIIFCHQNLGPLLFLRRNLSRFLEDDTDLLGTGGRPNMALSGLEDVRMSHLGSQGDLNSSVSHHNTLRREGGDFTTRSFSTRPHGVTNPYYISHESTPRMANDYAPDPTLARQKHAKELFNNQTYDVRYPTLPTVENSRLSEFIPSQEVEKEEPF